VDAQKITEIAVKTKKAVTAANLRQTIREAVQRLGLVGPQLRPIGKFPAGTPGEVFLTCT
jgi:hypothetical protein